MAQKTAEFHVQNWEPAKNFSTIVMVMTMHGGNNNKKNKGVIFCFQLILKFRTLRICPCALNQHKG